MTPFATIGVLAAVLVWEIEHVGSILLALAIAAGGIVFGVVVSRRLRRDIARVADYYAGLLHTADEQSRTAGYQIHVAKPVEPSELVSTVEWLAHTRDREAVSGELRA